MESAPSLTSMPLGGEPRLVGNIYNIPKPRARSLVHVPRARTRRKGLGITPGARCAPKAALEKSCAQTQVSLDATKAVL